MLEHQEEWLDKATIY